MPRDRHCTDRSRRYISPISECYSSDDYNYPSDYSGLRRGGKVRSRSLSRSISRSSSVSHSRERRIGAYHYSREEAFYRDNHNDYPTHSNYSNSLRYEKSFYYDTHSPSRSPSPVAHYPGLSHPRLDYWPDSGRCWSRDERSFRTDSSRWNDRHSDRSPTRYLSYRRHEESSPIERHRYPSQQPRSPVRYRSRYRERGFSERRFSRHRAPWDSPPPASRRRQSFSRDHSRTRRFYNSPLRRSPQRSPPWDVKTIRDKTFNSDHLKQDANLLLRKKCPEYSQKSCDNDSAKKSRSTENSKASPSPIPSSSQANINSINSPVKPALDSSKAEARESDIPATFNISWPYVSNSQVEDSGANLAIPLPNLKDHDKDQDTNQDQTITSSANASTVCPIYPTLTQYPSLDRSNTFPPLLASGGFVPFINPEQGTWPPVPQSNQHVPFLPNIHSGLPQPGHFLPPFIPPLPPYGLPPRPWVSHIPYRPARSLPVNPNLRFYNNPTSTGSYSGHPYNIPSRHVAPVPPRPYIPSSVCSQLETQKVDFKEKVPTPVVSAQVSDKVSRPADSSSITPKDIICSPVKIIDTKSNHAPDSTSCHVRANLNPHTSTSTSSSASTTKNPYSASHTKPIEIQENFPSLEPIQRLLDFNGSDKLVATSKPTFSVPPPSSRRPSHNVARVPFISKPDFLVQYEEGLYPHPWPSKVDDEATERKAELQRLRAAESKIRFQLERSKFGLTLSQLEVSRLEFSLSVPE